MSAFECIADELVEPSELSSNEYSHAVVTKLVWAFG